MKGDKLLPKEELFCQYFAKGGRAFGNETLSYSLAFGKEIETEEQYKVCSTSGSRLFAKVKIYKRCEELLDERITDEIADKELAFVMQQRKNLHAKVSAISEYNKVRGRITTKHKFEGIDTETLKQRLAETIAGGDGDSDRDSNEE